MPLTVPPSHIESVKKFVELSDEQMTLLLKALTLAGPQFNLRDLADKALEDVKLPKDLVRGIVQVVGSLYITKDTQNAPTDAFVEEVFLALSKAGAFSKEPDDAQAQWAKLRKFLAAALSLEDTVGTAAKAGHILTQHERIFVSARILTDVRAIFHVNTTEKPHSALLIHMLRITYRDMHGNISNEFFALDSNDIRAFKLLIDRAIQKEETLRKMMKDASIDVLHPKEYY
jgi:hypothetical protein